MKKVALVTMAGLLGLAGAASAETWKNVAIIDGHCVSKVKADPDKHSTQCALQCHKGGYGLLDTDGTYRPFDAAGSEKALAALKATKKTDHLRATVTGERDGKAIKVQSIAID